MKKDHDNPSILLSLVTPPFLLGLTLVQSITQGLREFGEMSEEIFRGDRLPLLKFPETSSEEKVNGEP